MSFRTDAFQTFDTIEMDMWIFQCMGEYESEENLNGVPLDFSLTRDACSWSYYLKYIDVLCVYCIYIQLEKLRAMRNSNEH